MGMWELADRWGTLVAFGAGEVLLQHGEATRHCYAIRSGEVLVTATSMQGATLVLARRGPGTMIGELGALDGEPRSATVRAVSPIEAVVLGTAQLERMLLSEPELALAEVKRLSRQLRELTERYALRGDELRTRVERVLATHAAETGDPVFRSTREELAGWVGATREAVTRTLRELESAGSVALRRGAVELLTPA